MKIYQLDRVTNQLSLNMLAADVLEHFQKIVKEEPDVSAAVAAIRTLMWILENMDDG